ncbi:hypothetical protein GQ54DRAFT_295074 [Martensiomyces pterosporus]|nr:hypothetical protein GQ54DRAFT_295074 [Martensiomyces pterosporus]
MVIEKPEAFLGVVASAEAQQDPLETVQLIDFVVNKCSTYVHLQGTARHMQSWAGVASRIASIFDKSQSILKFELMPVLASCLEPIDRDDAVRCDGTGSCRMLVRHVSSGCASVLSQKSETTKFSDQALVLFSHLVRLWPSHVFSGSFLKSADAKEKAEANQRSVELILRLACIEGLSSIDTMMITPPDTKGRSAAHDSDAKRMRLGWKLPVCSETLAGWLEWVGRWLEDQQERPDVDDGCIYGVMSEVQKLADAAVAFLVDWKERVGSDQAMLKNGPAIVASVTRLLAQWLATDPNMHRKALPVLPMFTSWIQNSDSDGRAAIADYVRPCISFALDTCGIDEIRYVKDLKARELRHDRTRAQDYASPWVGTIEFDDLAHAVYNIPSDEEILQARREQP